MPYTINTIVEYRGGDWKIMRQVGYVADVVVNQTQDEYMCESQWFELKSQADKTRNCGVRKFDYMIVKQNSVSRTQEIAYINHSDISRVLSSTPSRHLNDDKFIKYIYTFSKEDRYRMLCILKGHN